ncbi:PTB domain-containing engulfment adapter protein 1 isoform X5 [Pan paniscus]|uniref:PTB domain-containing engulfment adapter protein 1 isoform X5 n=1 Tax=Homo sapiens TaxID=9606 RepID=UPI00005794E6|nr:PTB domain-containing engulfment adapter protein 1 isoform X5 [Homo sapiens]XP_016805649.1 PTB domain-containing engulfment adapter protein 1 isoform X5 [Pan troglodytes]XP_047300651.1 PTB domain-containing engulfment adapter protein 1 isoform X5 [Homo sapiens]XP_047300652.1 PTB domain-containing engulfment adapter protein 1 isoform X5 [Homo sapiens]XP_054198453.1 PTB domain-containing engulfment adapter protein 1 isoform X5 [Homo sapiens]XP_054198454.1 PTB domain-containing engulfment adap|eukprot:XP_011509635.1 PTB domain-containing engulfment adapter protein 1 isoform X6 [Homo sapiens]
MNRAFSRKKDKTWMHTPEALSKHFIPYNAKFLGSTEVEQPKGTEVVRDAVRKLKFARHIKKSEGQKIPKVELQISIYGVKILEPKTKAEEITLTIGQAFDLAYRKFLESGGKDVETRKQIAGLQKRIQDLETENMELKNKVQDLENQLRITQVSAPPLLHNMSDHEQHVFQRCSSSFWRSNGDSSPCLNISSISVTPINSPDSRLSLGLLIPPPSKCGFPKPVSESSIPRPHAGSMTPKSPSTDIFDMIPFSPISHQSSMPTRNGTQPPPVPSRSTEIKRDLFGAEPFDPFNCGAADFPPDIQSKLDEMQEGFKMGLTLEGTVFCLDPLDSRC